MVVWSSGEGSMVVWWLVVWWYGGMVAVWYAGTNTVILIVNRRSRLEKFQSEKYQLWHCNTVSLGTADYQQLCTISP